MIDSQPLGINELIEGHTFKRYDGELSHLHYLVLEMGALVLSQVREALAAFKGRDLALAHKVVPRDGEVDRLEVAADEEIVKLIARRSPVGSDLRMVMAVSKSVSDLERIGDEAVRIAGLVIQIFGSETNDPNSQLARDVNGMGVMAITSLKSAVELFDVWSEEKARAVIERHREMEEEFQSGLRRLMTYILQDSRNIGVAISLVLVIKSLERIGHHAQNLAEYTIFQVKGEDIRNQNP
ncbi:MAG TPA: phosphate signaling complex protein PhoU [Methylococcaceae bacterium]|jgi:phosphate transport system protein|nr:phosphate signaling complex protein PhoU [Methylococcaceae bacterium]